MAKEPSHKGTAGLLGVPGFVTYYRVNTAKQGQNGLSLEAHRPARAIASQSSDDIQPAPSAVITLPRQAVTVAVIALASSRITGGLQPRTIARL
jgi:hypothetical protein